MAEEIARVDQFPGLPVVGMVVGEWPGVRGHDPPEAQGVQRDAGCRRSGRSCLPDQPPLSRANELRDQSYCEANSNHE